MQSFADYKFVPELEHNLLAFGFSEPTPIQKEVIPAALMGSDIMAAAPTGTGKSAAFLLPIMHKILSEYRNTGDGHVRALIVAPTRELVTQTRDFLLHFSAALPIRVTTIMGGTGISPQLQELRQGTDIVIATPGRVVELIERGELVAQSVDQFVLDEVDRMVDMGFVHEINSIVKELSKVCQMMFFSATVTREAAKIGGQALRRPIMIDLSGSLENLSIPITVEAQVFFVEKSRKRKLLHWLLGDLNYEKVLIFVRNRAEAERVAKMCDEISLKCGTIFGEKSNAARAKVVEQFSQGKLAVLISTDILSRGIDVVGLSHVINYSLPQKPEQFVHRIGRTGRAGNNGVAINLCDQDDRISMYRIDRAIEGDMEVIGWQPFHSDKVENLTYEEAEERLKKGRGPKTEQAEERRVEKAIKATKEQEEALQKKMISRQKKKKALTAKYGEKLTGKGRQKGLANKSKRKRK